ncbi:MAG: S-adenosylmethionine decarboxylase [Chloroflexi bacterium]|nr:S-adenosylmethionine decarboxylase [Chloroflexota bacterium]
MHLAIDGYGGDVEKMRSPEAIYQLLDTYPGLIGMNKVSEPLVRTYVGPVPEDWGISGFVIIAESHISIHTFPDRRFVQIDVFSCKEFDAEEALKELCRAFSFRAVKTWVLERGLEYYNPAGAQQDGAQGLRVTEGTWR